MTRTRRLQILIGLGLLALLAVVIAIAAGGGDSGTGSSGGTTTTPGGGSAVDELFADIPAEGMTLGLPDAKATLEEFVDPQCPFCAQFAEDVLPTVITNYVRPGSVRLRLRLQTFIGPDSLKAARAVVAAGFQNKAWPYLEVLFANQGPENSGYVTDEFLRSVGQQVQGLDVERLMTDVNDKRVEQILAADNQRYIRFRLDGTPGFVLDPGTGGGPRKIEGNLEPGPFTQTLDQALADR